MHVDSTKGTTCICLLTMLSTQHTIYLSCLHNISHINSVNSTICHFLRLTSSHSPLKHKKAGSRNSYPNSPNSRKSLAFYTFSLAYFVTRDINTTHSTWLDRSGLMSVIGNLSRLIWFVLKYLRLFVETYLQILQQKYLDTFCYTYRSLNLARLRKKFNFFNRFYYYSDSNIKVKSCEEPPSPQPCPFFLQKQVNSYFSS